MSHMPLNMFCLYVVRMAGAVHYTMSSRPTALQIRKAVTAYFSSDQILAFGLGTHLYDIHDIGNEEKDQFVNL